jgi:uncharacterized repeat protein (TIGR02543 family)
MRKGLLVTFLVLLTVFAMVGIVSCGDGGGSSSGTDKITITFDQNYEGQPSQKITRTIDIGAAIGDLPTPTRPEWELDGWYRDSGATGAAVIPTDTFNAKITLYAKWTPGETGPYQYPAVVKFYSENNAYVMYRFDLPNGKTWGDYKSLTVDYKVDEANLNKDIRSHRLYGNFKLEDFVAEPTVEGYYWVNLNLKNGPYIFNDKGVDGGVSTIAGGVANEWFTVTHDLANPKYHAEFDEANAPVPGDTGPFYLAVGMGGNNSERNTDRTKGVVQLITNVTLVGYDPTDNIISNGAGFPGPAFLFYVYPGEPEYSWFGREDQAVVYRTRPPVVTPPGDPLPKPIPGIYELGEINWRGGSANNQGGWHFDTAAGRINPDTDEYEPNPNRATQADVAKFTWAKYLVIEVTELPTGGGKFVCQFDPEGDNTNHWQEGAIVWNNDDGSRELGAFDVSAEDSDSGNAQIWVDIEEALGELYGSFHIAQTRAGLLFSYWGTAPASNINDVGITRAFLIVDDE